MEHLLQDIISRLVFHVTVVAMSSVQIAEESEERLALHVVVVAILLALFVREQVM